MIELRWVERRLTYIDGKQIIMSEMMPGEIVECLDPSSFRTSVERVLQYRHSLGMRVEDAAGTATEIWSDWQDVPVVTEE